jgi:signal transduction histidine kinase/putative methionine-R-sulfoxide reductase with GAF domain
MRPEELPGRRALAGEEPEPTLVRFRRGSDRRERFSSVTAVPVKDARGEVVYAITYFREVTNEHMLARRRGLAVEIGQILASTLDYETTLRKIAAAAVPRIADWCLVDVLREDGTLVRVATEPRDSETSALLDQVSRSWPNEPGAAGASRVVRTGEPEFAREIDDDFLVANAKDDEHLRVLRELGLTSYICVPIRLGDRVVAAVSLVTGESGRRFAPDDLVLAEDIVAQAATALENASLYREAKRTSALLDSLYDGAPIGLGFWDRDLRYVRVNEALAVINELSAEEHQGRTFAEVIPHLAPVLEPIARRVLETGDPVTALEMSAGTPSDPQAQRFWLSSYYPVLAADGEALGVGAVVEEVTDRRRAEQRTELQHAVTRILSVTDSVEAAVSKVLEAVCLRLGWDVGCYWPLDPEEPRLTWVREGVHVEGFVELTRLTPLSPALLPGRVAESGDAEWLEDFSPATFQRISVAQAERLTSGVGFPILIEGEVAGVLEIFSQARRPRDPEIQQTLFAIGGQLGQFLRRKRVEDERVQLLQRERQARAEAESAAATLRKLARVSEVALDRVGLNELLEALLARIVEVLESDTAAILLIDSNNELRVRATLGLERELEHARSIPLGAGMAGRVAAARAPAVIADLGEVELVSPVLRERGINSLVAVPLVADDTVIGVVHAGSEAYAQFTGDDARLLELIGERISLAIKSAALVEAERAAQERLQFLSEASVTLASSLDLETTLRRTAQLATAHFADAAVVDLVDGDSIKRVVIEVAEGRLSPAVRDGLLANPPSSDDEAGSARVIRTGQEEVLADLLTDPGPLAAVTRGRPGIAPTVELLRPCALVYMPLRARERVLGVLALIRTAENFSAGDVETVRELAARAAVAVDNANLYRDAERGRDRLGFLATASALLGAELDEGSSLERLAALVARRHADWCMFHLAGENATLLVAIAHRDGNATGGTELELELADAVGRAITTGEPELSPRAAPTEAGAQSTLIVPLVARGRTIGAMSWVWAESAHEYNAGDLEFALDLGRRAAAAIDNAQLYREAEERGQAARVLASVGDGVFLVDRRGCVRTWNRAAAVATGLRVVDVLDRPAAEAIPGWASIAPRVPVADAAVVSPPRPESLPLDLGERELWLSLHGVAVPDGIVYAFRDLTEERALESMRTEFVSTVSHELRTPLAAIYGAAMTLRRSDVALDDDQRAKMLDVVSGEAERLARTVNDILWASRLDAGSLNVAIGSCDPARLAREVVEAQLAHLDPRYHLVLEAPDDLPDVVGDEDKIGRVLINLVDNAIKYSPDGGRVEITLSPVGSSVRFSVTDEGLGVPPSEQRRIFEKFYRLDPNMTRGVGGTGLGLFICRELVRRMDGRIWVESAGLGRGSTFSLELPAA